MAAEGSLFVAREADLSTLLGHWEQAAAGTPRFVRLQAPFGGGRRALAGEFLRRIAATHDDAIQWRVNCMEQENGLQWVVRLYGSLMASLGNDVLRRGKVEMVLNSAMPSQPKRVQGWFQSFIGTLKESKTDAAKGAVQLKLPQDNPLIGLVEVIAAIARKIPVVLDLQNAQVVYSVALAQFLEALHGELKGNGKLLVILHDEEPTEATESLYPMPLVELFERRADLFVSQVIAPWAGAEVGKYLESKGLSGDAERIAAITSGRPGFVAEVVDILADDGRLDGDLSDVTLASLVPLSVDEDELEAPEGEPAEGERKHASAADIGQVAYLAALLGQAFPSGLVADMGGYDRDSIDDLIDAADDLFEEVQFAEDLGTWIYKFARGTWREGVLEQNTGDEADALARRVGTFLERFLVPRGYGFIIKTARIYAEHGAPNRARILRSLALSSDAPDMWGLSYDLMNYFDDTAWPAPMRRTVLQNLLERLIGGGNLQAAEKVHGELEAFATSQDDKELSAWLKYAGSRMDARRRDFYRARDRAEQAIALYEELGSTQRVAELYTHLAGIELQEGSLDKAAELADKSMEVGVQQTDDGGRIVAPQVFANAEHIRGLVARRNGQLEQAAEHFQRANEVAGQAGIANLALDSGLAYGEALLASRDIEKARQVLERVHQIAVGVKNPARERSAAELLAQAEGAVRNYDKALQLAQRVLQLSQQLQLEQVLPIDLYNLGFFLFVKERYAEARGAFEQAENRIGQLGNHPVVKELYYFLGLTYFRLNDLDKAKEALNNGLKPAQRANDWQKTISALDTLAGIEHSQGHLGEAKRLLNDAIGFAKQANLKDAKKSLSKKLEALQ